MAQANSKEWLDGLTFIRKLKADRIVPGRGPVCGREATERMSEYIRFLRARVRTSYRQSKTKQETVITILREVASWFPISPTLKSKTESQIKQGIGRIWNEVDKASRARGKAAEAAEVEAPPQGAEETGEE
jgi:cyclase